MPSLTSKGRLVARGEERRGIYTLSKQWQMNLLLQRKEGTGDRKGTEKNVGETEWTI